MPEETPGPAEQSGITATAFPVVLIAIGVAATIAARLLSAWSLSSAPHVMDELTYYLQARTYAAGHLTAPERLPHAAFNLWFVEDRGRMFGVFPPGWPLALALGLRLHCEAWTNPFLHGLTTVLLGRAAGHVAGRRLGVVTSVLYGASPQALVLAASAMSHSLVALLATIVLNACVEMLRSGPWAWWMACGAALGLAAMTRPLCAVVLGAQVAVCCVVLARRGGWRRLLWPGALSLTLPGMAGVMLVLWYNTQLTGSPWVFPQTEYFDTHLPPVNIPSFRYGPGCNALGFGHACEYVGTTGVHDLRNALRNTAANLRAWSALACAGPLLSLLVALGLWVAIRGRRDVLVLVSVVPAAVLLYGLYWHEGTCYGARYYHAALPALVLTAALGISGACQWMRRESWRTAALTAALLVSVALDAKAVALVQQEMGPAYFGVDDRFSLLASTWTEPPAVVMVAFRENAHPRSESYPMTTGGLLEDSAWQGPVRVLGAMGANTPDLSGPVVFAKFHPGLVRTLREKFPDRTLWLYIVEPQGSDTLVRYDKTDLGKLEEGAEPPPDNFGVFSFHPA